MDDYLGNGQGTDEVKERGMEDEMWKACKKPIAFLTRTLGLTDTQVILVAMLAEAGEPMLWRGLSKYMRCSRLRAMAYKEDMTDLLAKRYVKKSGSFERSCCYQACELKHGVVSALRHYKAFVPEKIDGITTNQLINRMCGMMAQSRRKRCQLSLFLPNSVSKRPANSPATKQIGQIMHLRKNLAIDLRVFIIVFFLPVGGIKDRLIY